MSSIGNAWVGEDNISAARMNAKTVWIGTGTQLAALSPTFAGQIAVSTTTASGFTGDTAYFRNAANDTWLFLSMSKHTHSTDTHLSGGLYTDIRYANFLDAYTLDYKNAKKEDFHSILGGSGTVTNDVSSSSGKVIIDTGIVANDYAQIVDYGVKFGFGRKSRFAVKMGLNGETNLITRIGIAGEDINGANTTTRKYGIEGCDSTGINWVMFSANGTTRSGTVTTNTGLNSGFDTTGQNYRLDHTPNVDIKFYANGTNCGANCTISAAGGFIPNDGDTGSDYVLRLGVKTTNTTGKKIALWGCQLEGKINDSRWV